MRIGYCLALAGLFAAYVGLAAVVPPADDELYYWCWAQTPQLSYFDHPPMTAYMIRASTAVFGDSLVAVRLPAIVTTLAVLVVVGWLAVPRKDVPVPLLAPRFSFGAVIVTPDTPLLLFWSLYVAWLVVVHRKLTPLVGRVESSRPDVAHPSGLEDSTRPTNPVPLWLWALGGLILGCGMLGKYTTGLAVPAGFVSFVLARTNWKTWLPGYALQGVVATVVFLPVIAFNIERDFAPMKFQWNHAMVAKTPGIKPFAEFAGMQILLVGTLPFLLLPIVAWNWRRLAAEPKMRACAAMFAIPFAFFLYKATRGPLEGNWGLACFVSCWPIAADWFDRVAREKPWLKWTTVGTFAIPAACVLLVTAHLVHPLSFFPPQHDRITRQAVKLDLAMKAASDANAHGKMPMYVTNYQWTALMRFAGADARQIDGATRPSHFTTPAQHLTDVDKAYVLNDGPLPPNLTEGFGPPEVIGWYPLEVRGKLMTAMMLMVYTRTEPRGKVSASR